MKQLVNDIERKAAEWAAKTESGTLAAGQEAAFEAWLDADPRHLGAYLKVQAALAKIDRLGAEAQLLSRASTVVSFDRLRQSRRRFVMAGTIAATIAVIVAGGAVWQSNTYAAAYETKIGESRVVTLPDGSAITLNTDTKVAVHYSLFARGLTLDRGEALFNVAKNKERPFHVKAGDVQVRAVGTSFAVSKLVEHPLKVTVREGVVSISEPDSTTATMVGAGMRATGRASGGFDVESLDAGQLVRELAWLDGRVFFRQQTLAAAVREFERYSKSRIIIEDPSVAGRTVTGMYVATDPDGFARAVAVFMDLDVVRDRATLRLRQKKT